MPEIELYNAPPEIPNQIIFYMNVYYVDTRRFHKRRQLHEVFQELDWRFEGVTSLTAPNKFCFRLLVYTQLSNDDCTEEEIKEEVNKAYRIAQKVLGDYNGQGYRTLHGQPWANIRRVTL